MARGPFRYPFPLWLLYPAVLLSGGTALVYEIVWARRLALLLGSATSAASAVLSAFMFGLAAGALLVGRRADASKRPLRWYGILELGIGVYALAFDTLTDIAKGPLGTHPWLCSFALLSLPAALMGGTLPVLARAAADTTQRATRAFGSLYGVNALGAVLGALFAALVLLEAFGLSGTARVAAVLNISLGVVFWLFGAAAGDREVYVAPEEAPPPRALGDAEPSIVLAFFVAGFAALGLEIAWFRLLVHYLEGFTIAFGLMLAAYLLGLGAGALGGTSLALFAKNPRRLLARILLVEAVLAVATLLLLNPLGDAVEAMRAGYRHDAIDSGYAGRLFWTAFAIVFPATFCAGMLMPVVARIALSDRETIGRHTGVVYAASTAGAVLAPPIAAFWLLPALGAPKTIAALAALLLFAGTSVAFGRGLREWAFAGAAAVGFVALCLAGGLGTPLVERSHVFRSGKPRRLLHASPGEISDVAVVEDVTDATRRLYLDGFSAAETGAHYAYMRMQGHLPVLLHGQAESVLVIAFGTGTTAGAVKCHPEVKKIVCVEIEPGVYDAAPFFEAQNRNVLSDAQRVERVVADGREYLRRGGKFDVITLEPLMPYTPGAVHLYTKEFYELARAALNPSGIVCQWIPPQGVSGADFKRLVASAAAVFGHVSVWYFPHAVLVLGSDAEPQIDGPSFLQRASTADVLADLQFASVEDAPHLLGAHVVSGTALRDALGDAAPFVDDRPDLEFRPLARGLGRKSVQCHAEVLEFLRDHHEAKAPWLSGSGEKRVAGVDAALATGRDLLALLARMLRAQLEGAPSPASAEIDPLVERDPASLLARVLRDTVRYAELVQAGRFDEAAQLAHAPDRSRAYLGLAKDAQGDARRYYLTLAVRENALLDPAEKESSAKLLDEMAAALSGPEKRFCENRARILRGQAWQEGEESLPKIAVPEIEPALEAGDEEAARGILERARQADLGDQIDRAAWEWYETQEDKRTAFRLLVGIGSAHTLRAAARLLTGGAEDRIAVAPFYCARFPGTRVWAELCQGPDSEVKEAAADAAKECGTRSHLPELLVLCRDEDQGVRRSAFISFREIEPRADGTGYDPDLPNDKALKALADLVEKP